MGVRIRAVGVDAESSAREYSSPVPRGLEGIFFLNTSLDKIAHNYAQGKAKGTVMGAPLPGAAGTTFKSQSNYVLTDVSETDEMTLFVLARSALDGTDQTSRAVFLSNYSSANNPPGLGVYVQNTNRISAFANFGADAASNTLVPAVINSTNVVTNWNLYAAIIKAGSVTIRNLTTGQTGTLTNVAPRRKGAPKICIGSSYTTYSGACDIAVAQMHSVALTETEIQAVTADLRAYALRKGITA